MAEEVKEDRKVVVGVVESPPVAAAPVKEAVDEGPRRRMNELARELGRKQNQRLLAEYLTLRRMLRTA
jgi:hypothetical protein